MSCLQTVKLLRSIRDFPPFERFLLFSASRVLDTFFFDGSAENNWPCLMVAPLAGVICLSIEIDFGLCK